jgi:hypothetical protein
MALTEPTAVIISTHLPDLAGNFIAARAERLRIEKLVEEMKAREETLKDAIVSKMREQGMTAIGTDNGLVKMNELIEPVATDWQMVWDHVQKTGHFDLLHRRLANTAVKARWESGEEIPGVTSTTVFKLTVSKAK